MRALRIFAEHDLRLEEEPAPAAGQGESLLRVTAVGICGSDLHWFEDGAIGDDTLNRPLVLGHEFAGIVDSGEWSGRRVAVEPAITCSDCRFCHEGNPNFCENMSFAGHGPTDGALRDLMSWPTRLLFPLPEELTDVDGAMLEPLGVALHTVDLGHLRPGMRVGVFGCGPIGLLVLQLVRLSGALAIVATDLHRHRLEAARELGATQTFLADGSGQEVAAIEASVGSQGLDVVFEAAGDNAAIHSAVSLAKPGGTVVLAGIPTGDSIRLSASVTRRKGLTFRLVRRMKHTYPRAIGLVLQGMVDVRNLVSHRFPLEQFEQAFRVAERREGLKVVVEPAGAGGKAKNTPELR